MLPHCLLACIVSDEKSVILVCYLCVICLFLRLLLRFPLYYCYKQFDYDVPWYSFPCTSYPWDLLGFLDPWVYSVHLIWEFSVTNFSNIFFCIFFHYFLLLGLQLHVYYTSWSCPTIHRCFVSFLFFVLVLFLSHFEYFLSKYP